PRRHPVPQWIEGSDEGAALQPGEAAEHQGPLVDEQAAAPCSGQPQEVVDPAPGLTSTDRLTEVRPKTLDHVALWVADRDRIADFLTERLSMHVIEQTDKFTLVGTDARRGKLTLFVADGPRERGALKHVGLRVSDLEEAKRNGMEVADVVDAPNTYAVFVWGPERVKIEYVEQKPTFALK